MVELLFGEGLKSSMIRIITSKCKMLIFNNLDGSSEEIDKTASILACRPYIMRDFRSAGDSEGPWKALEKIDKAFLG